MYLCQPGCCSGGCSHSGCCGCRGSLGHTGSGRRTWASCSKVAMEPQWHVQRSWCCQVRMGICLGGCTVEPVLHDHLNPVTAPACQISGLKSACTCRQCVCSIAGPVCYNKLLSYPVLYILTKIISQTQTCKKENKTEKGLGSQTWHFYWSFSSDIMAVKWLIL